MGGGEVVDELGMMRNQEALAPGRPGPVDQLDEPGLDLAQGHIVVWFVQAQRGVSPHGTVKNSEQGDQIALAVGELIEIQRELRRGRCRIVALVLKVELEDSARLTRLRQI